MIQQLYSQMFTQEIRKRMSTKTCVRMFTDLLIITKTRTQPKWPSTCEWMNCAACIQLISLKNKKQQSTVMYNNTLNLKHIIRNEKDQNSGCLWEWGEVGLTKSMREFSREIVMFYISTRVTCENSSNDTFKFCAFHYMNVLS